MADKHEKSEKSHNGSVHEHSANGHAAKQPKNEFVRTLTQDVENAMESFLEAEGIGGSLTASDRRRLVGAGVRNNGFIDKAA